MAESGTGTTAADLGLLLSPGELPVDRLNRGFGILSNFGPDFTLLFDE